MAHDPSGLYMTLAVPLVPGVMAPAPDGEMATPRRTSCSVDLDDFSVLPAGGGRRRRQRRRRGRVPLPRLFVSPGVGESEALRN